MTNSKPTIYLSKGCEWELKRLLIDKEFRFGLLWGSRTSSTIAILGFSQPRSATQINWAQEKDSIQSYLPVGCDMLGVLVAGNADEYQLGSPDAPIVCKLDTTSHSFSLFTRADLEKPIDFTVLCIEMIASKMNFIFLRCALEISDINQFNSTSVSFSFPNDKIVTETGHLLPISTDAKLKDAVPSRQDAASIDIVSLPGIGPVVHVSMLKSRKAKSGLAPMLVRDSETLSTPVQADVLAFVSDEMTLKLVISQLLSRLKSQLSLQSPRVSHFCLSNGFPITLIHDPSQQERKELHERFILSDKKAYFRPECALSFKPEKVTQLRDVHVGIRGSPVQGGREYLVDGSYRYYHYLQDGINDSGWGCAYRSLQTIASWLELNHYSAIGVPNHREIQEILVKIGDKPRNFIGTKDWIGSVEIGFVLNERYNVISKSLTVDTGADLATKGRELAEHFETQGSPVMIGGGALAQTCLGIDYNSSTGDIAFLILDPHYTGPEDLNTIQMKSVSLEGYRAVPCGWRRASTFASNSFYNLCLPQRPAGGI